MKIGLIYYVESFHDKRSHKIVRQKFHEKLKSHSIACRNVLPKKSCRKKSSKVMKKVTISFFTQKRCLDEYFI